MLLFSSNISLAKGLIYTRQPVTGRGGPPNLLRTVRRNELKINDGGKCRSLFCTLATSATKITSTLLKYLVLFIVHL